MPAPPEAAEPPEEEPPEKDPDEMCKLVGSSEAHDRQAHLTEMLARRLMEAADVSPKPTQMA